MKKVKLSFNFLSAADKAFGVLAVLFSSPRAAVIIAREVPFFRRR